MPVEELVSRYAHRLTHGHAWQPPAHEEEAAPAGAVSAIGGDAASDKGDGPTVVGHCPECRGELIMMDGCPTCYAGCGWSKCG